MSSDRKINYSLRPSKTIERKMMLDVFKEVCVPSNVEDYQYIGFGSSFFHDFKMIHRELKISEMISVEKNSSPLNIERCKFNRPYSCIKILPGYSYQVLPKVNWKKKAIVWLDYDKCLKNYMFEDIETCCQKAKTGGFMIISLRKEFDQNSISEFKEEFGDKTPNNLVKEGLEPKYCHLTLREMFLKKINETLLNEYSTRDESERLIFKQLFNFIYRDDIQMFTFGGMFIFQKEEQEFEKFKFNSYDFVNSVRDPINISFPIITNKEYHEMTSLLPSEKEEFIENKKIDFIPEKQKANYYSTYRYYPAYIEIREL